MACIPVKGDGWSGFVCFRGPKPRWPICSVKGCDKPAPYLCDAPIKPRQRGRKLQTTCDRKLCEEHRTTVGDDLDHCPFHVAKAAGGGVMSQARVDLALDTFRFLSCITVLSQALAAIGKVAADPELRAALRKLGEHMAIGEALDALALERGVRRAWLPGSQRAGSFIGEDDEALRQRVLCESRRPIR